MTEQIEKMFSFGTNKRLKVLRSQRSRVTSLDDLRTKSEVILIIGDLISPEEHKSSAERARVEAEIYHALLSDSPSLDHDLSLTHINKNTFLSPKKKKNKLREPKKSDKCTDGFFKVQSCALEMVGERRVRSGEEPRERVGPTPTPTPAFGLMLFC